MGRTALIMVSEKDGIRYFGERLVKMGWNIIASRGTASALNEAGVSCSDISSITKGGPILGHRVVSLSRELYAGLLARDTPEDRKELETIGVPWIDLACIDFYPLEKEIAKLESTLESVIEATDIGGPTALRAAAKGGRIAIGDPADRQRVIDWLQAGEPDRERFINELAAKAEFIVAKYVSASARYRGNGAYDGLLGRKVADCAYGENKYQTPAAVFTTDSGDSLSIPDTFKLVQGSAPSFNNYVDMDRLLQTLTHIIATFARNRGRAATPYVAIAVKHGNACGAAMGWERDVVLKKMILGDRDAIFGGLVITNFEIAEEETEILLHWGLREGETRRNLDGIIAPRFAPGVSDLLKRKNDKCRLLENKWLLRLNEDRCIDTAMRFRPIRGGFLKQPNYSFILDLRDPDLVWIGEINPRQVDVLMLVTSVADTSNSNTITLGRYDSATAYLIANAVSQQSRVAACNLAESRAKMGEHDTNGSIGCSDSFFPFPDGPKKLAEMGVKVVLTTSGSVNDEKTIEVFKDAGITVLMIPDAKGRGFFGH